MEDRLLHRINHLKYNLDKTRKETNNGNLLNSNKNLQKYMNDKKIVKCIYNVLLDKCSFNTGYLSNNTNTSNNNGILWQCNTMNSKTKKYREILKTMNKKCYDLPELYTSNITNDNICEWIDDDNIVIILGNEIYLKNFTKQSISCLNDNDNEYVYTLLKFYGKYLVAYTFNGILNVFKKYKKSDLSFKLQKIYDLNVTFKSINNNFGIFSNINILSIDFYNDNTIVLISDTGELYSLNVVTGTCYLLKIIKFKRWTKLKIYGDIMIQSFDNRIQVDIINWTNENNMILKKIFSYNSAHADDLINFSIYKDEQHSFVLFAVNTVFGNTNIYSWIYNNNTILIDYDLYNYTTDEMYKLVCVIGEPIQNIVIFSKKKYVDVYYFMISYIGTNKNIHILTTKRGSLKGMIENILETPFGIQLSPNNRKMFICKLNFEKLLLYINKL